MVSPSDDTVYLIVRIVQYPQVFSVPPEEQIVGWVEHEKDAQEITRQKDAADPLSQENRAMFLDGPDVDATFVYHNYRPIMRCGSR